eukprot:4210140-Pleurochrysis_carterae.AAC.1
MVCWMGRGMHARPDGHLHKPTPVGLEINTLCDALRDILVYFKGYEGKDAMALKECNIDAPDIVGPGYPKSIALR